MAAINLFTGFCGRIEEPGNRKIKKLSRAKQKI